VKEYNLFDALLLLWISLFIIFAISSLYPQMASIPGLDMVRHFSSSRLLMLTQDAYHSPYPWFHMTWAVVYELSSPPMDVFQTGLAYLSLVVVLSFYIMAKAYLGNVDKRAPILSTVFFSVFSGFGWLHFLGEKLITSDPSKQLDILRASNNASYWDIGYGQGPWLWLWFRPLTLGLTGLFVLLYLLKRTDVDKKSFFILSYFTVLSLSLLHFSELIFYTMLLFMLSLFLAPAVQIRLKDSLFALLLALITLSGFSILYNFISVEIQIPVIDIIIAIIISALSISIIKLKQRISNPTLRIFKTEKETYIYYIISGLTALWLAMLLYWLTNANSFQVSMVPPIWAVPWMLYPVLLGICGLLTFPAIFHIIKRYRNQAVITFVLMFILSILFGRLLTYMNLQSFTGYYERRFIPLAFSASAIMASILILHAIKRIQRNRFRCSLLLSLLVVGGLTSTILSIDYQNLAMQESMLNSAEQSQVVLLNKLNPNAYLLTFSPRSLRVAEYAPFAWRIGYFRDHIWPATSPELVLNTLFSTGHPAAIYLSEKDHTQLLTDPYITGYVIQHLLNTLPPFLCNDNGALIYQTQAIAPPTQNSSIILVMPENYSTVNSLYAYDIMSSAGYNYTTAYISDVKTLAEAEIIVVPSEILASKILDLRNDLQLNFSKLIILNLDGYYGKLAEINHPSLNATLTSTNFGEAFLRDSAHPYETLTNITGIEVTPFILETTSLNNSLILADDNASTFWKASAGLEGNISTPELIDDPKSKTSGENSLEIKVSNGSYAQWQVSWDFGNITDLEAYDFISFYWYGKGDGMKYVIQVNTNTPDKHFWYQFTDSWEGWKKVILPMHVVDGSHSLYGVQFAKVTKNEASWQNVKKIDFKLSGANLNVGGIFHMDRFAFERSTLANLKVVVHGDLQEFKLLNLNQDAYVPIAQINDNGTVPIQGYYLLDGASSKDILGEYAGNLTLTQYNETCSEASIRIKLPITSNESYRTQVGFAISPIYKKNKASNISRESNAITLPTEINVIPFKSEAKTVAYYNDEAKTFFASEKFQNQVNLTYLNFYPLISAPEEGSRELYPLIGNITKLVLGDPSSYTYQEETINSGSAAAFREAILKGNITATFESIIIQTENNGSLKVITDGNATHQFDSDERLCPTNFGNATLETARMEIIPGNGFYVKALVQNATLTLYGEQVDLVSFLCDHYADSLRGNELTIEMENATLLLRKPFINIDGQGSFKDLYTYQELNKRIRALGDNCEIHGHLTFTGIYGDTYSIVRQFDYTGSMELSRPLYGYDEWQSFVGMLPYLFLVAMIYVIFEAQKTLKSKD